MAPAAGMLMEVRRLLDEGAFRASRAQRFCTGAADCCRFRLTGGDAACNAGGGMGGLEGVACFRPHPVGAASGRELPFLERAGKMHDL